MLSIEDLTKLVNSWEEGTVGYTQEKAAIHILDYLGTIYGYGCIEQLAAWIRDIRLYDKVENVKEFKTHRFKELGWKLPKDYDKIGE